MSTLRSLHQSVRTADSSLNQFLQMPSHEFVCSKVTLFLEDDNIAWSMFDELLNDVSNLKHLVLEAQHNILQLVGIGEDWNEAKRVCVQFRELKAMLNDASQGAMQGRSCLQIMFDKHELECQKA